jgi:hypothetical protein
VERIGNLAEDKRMCVVKLLLRPESIVISAVSAVWAVARGRLCDAGSGCDFEITEALFDRALTSEIAVFIRIYRDAHLVSQSFEIVRVEAHKWIHIVIEQNAQHIHVNAY